MSERSCAAIAVPAVSVVVVREDPDFRVLMVQRARRSRSWAGLWVFPGGRVDDDESFWLAGSRELFEETGLALLRSDRADAGHGARENSQRAPRGARDVRGPTAVVRGASETESGVRRRIRELVHEKERPFERVVAELLPEFRFADFVPLARWITPSIEQRRFDATFFLLDVSRLEAAFLNAVSPDGSETIAVQWWVPSKIISAYRAKGLELAPPTLRILEQLSEWGSASASVRSARARPLLPILPRVIAGTESVQILLPWDPCYADTPGDGIDWDPSFGDEQFGPSRFLGREGQWRSESVSR